MNYNKKGNILWMLLVGAKHQVLCTRWLSIDYWWSVTNPLGSLGPILRSSKPPPTPLQWTQGQPQLQGRYWGDLADTAC